MQKVYDYIIIGGGIVGISTAWQLQQRNPDKSILVLEKEQGLAQHQTGHNSGVIHAGVYYAPGSLKARLCKAGVEATINFCKKHDIPVENCGKLLVSTNPLEVERMQALYQRCITNGIKVELLTAEQLKAAEPNISGLGAIHVSATSIVDYKRVTEKMAEVFIAAGGELRLNTEVTGLKESATGITVNALENGCQVLVQGNFLVSCAGLTAD